MTSLRLQPTLNMPTRTVRRLALGLCLAATAGCEGGPSAPEQFNPQGTLSFTYGGALAGTFTANGEMTLPAGADPQPVTGATAVRQNGTTTLLAFQATGGGRGDGFAVNLGDMTGTGTVQLGLAGCQSQDAATCRTGGFLPDVSIAQLVAAGDPAVLAQQAYVFVSGTATITSRSAVRIRGTFSGTAFRTSGSALSTLSINGQFDLPIRPE